MYASGILLRSRFALYISSLWRPNSLGLWFPKGYYPGADIREIENLCCQRQNVEIIDKHLYWYFLKLHPYCEWARPASTRFVTSYIKVLVHDLDFFRFCGYVFLPKLSILMPELDRFRTFYQ
jgi:hypothetical protein